MALFRHRCVRRRCRVRFFIDAARFNQPVVDIGWIAVQLCHGVVSHGFHAARALPHRKDDSCQCDRNHAHQSSVGLFHRIYIRLRREKKTKSPTRVDVFYFENSATMFLLMYCDLTLSLDELSSDLTTCLARSNAPRSRAATYARVSFPKYVSHVAKT